ASFGGSADYNSASQSATFTISKATPSVTVTNAGGPFTGNAYTAAATVTGVTGTAVSALEGVGLTLTYYAGSTASGTALSGAPSAAGTYTVLASFAGSADYAGASKTVTFTITKASSTVAVSNAGGVFTGNAYSATATVAGISGTPNSTLEGVGI